MEGHGGYGCLMIMAILSWSPGATIHAESKCQWPAWAKWCWQHTHIHTQMTSLSLQRAQHTYTQHSTDTPVAVTTHNILLTPLLRSPLDNRSQLGPVFVHRNVCFMKGWFIPHNLFLKTQVYMHSICADFVHFCIRLYVHLNNTGVAQACVHGLW